MLQLCPDNCPGVFRTSPHCPPSGLCGTCSGSTLLLFHIFVFFPLVWCITAFARLFASTKETRLLLACVHVFFFISDCIGVVMLLLIHCFTLAFCALLASVSHSCTINTCSSGMSLALTPPHLGTWPHQVPFAF